MRFLSISAFAFVLFAACNGNLTRKGFFFTSVKPADATLSLFIDGKLIGQLPYIDTAVAKPVCGVDSLTALCLSATVPNGKLQLEAKDASGKVKSSCVLKNKDNIFGSTRSVTGGTGGSSVAITDKCVIGNLFFN